MKKNFSILLGIMFLDSMALFIIVPIIPSLLEELVGTNIGYNSVWAGKLTFIFALMQFIFAPIIGYYSDKFGRKKIFIFTAITFIINFFIMAVATNIYLLFIGRLLSGISGASMGTVMAAVTDISQAENRVKNFGKVFGVFGLGMILGPVFGGFLGYFGTRIPFWFSCGIWILNLILIIFVFTETKLTTTDNKNIKNLFVAIFQMMGYRGFKALFCANLLFIIGFQTIVVVSSFYVKLKFNWNELNIGFSMGFFGIIYAILQIFFVRIVHSKLGSIKTILFGVTSAIFGYIIIAFASNPLMYYLGLFILAFNSVASSSVSELFATNVQTDEQGKLQGVISSVNSLAEIIGPILISYIFYFVISQKMPLNGGETFILASVLFLCSGLLYWTGFNRLANK